MSETTHHACALEINQTGILITGSSGSGKTSLMMGLLERAKLEKLNAFLIADDQVYLSKTEDALIANVPGKIAGLIEVRGYGVINHAHKTETRIRLVVELVKDHEVDRMPDPKSCNFEGLSFPLLEVPLRHENQAVRIIFAWLEENACLKID